MDDILKAANKTAAGKGGVTLIYADLKIHPKVIPPWN
jgi:hypothetical protein